VLELRDGREARGAFIRLDAAVHLEGIERPIELGSIARVAIELSTQDPE
jgi:hypothetical protein